VGREEKMVFVIDDLLKFQIDMGMKILRTIKEQVDEEMLNTEESVRKKVMEIQLKYENGEMEEEEYREIMAYLRKRLEEVKEE
jgi:uncharacterized membrane protein